MSLSLAIVGLPNVGKSTLFNALLKQQVALAANYPFATIEPNVGVVEVPDHRLPVLADVVHTSVIKPAMVEFVDVAGLVKGAAEGAGLGNQFLSHIRETAAICHVVRGFSDPDIIREGAVQPDEDLATIRTELYLADLATLDKQIEPKGAATPDQKARWQAVQTFRQLLSSDRGQEVIAVAQNDETLGRTAKELGLLSAKPELIVLNVDETEVVPTQGQVAEWAKKLQVLPTQIVVISAKIESELSALSSEDQQAFLAELGWQQSGLERLAKVAYTTLRLQSFLTAGEKEVRAWTIRQRTTAPEAAGVIHTDFVKHFIRANVANYQDFVECQGWKGVKEVGKLRQEGRDYVMQDGDVVEFMIGK